MLGSLVARFSERDEVARTEIAEGFDAWIGSLANGLRRIQAAGQIGLRADPEELATGLMVAFQGLHPGPVEPRHRADGDRPFPMIDHIESFGATGDGPPPVEHLDRAFGHGRVVSSPSSSARPAASRCRPGTRSVIREGAVPRAHAPGRDCNCCSDPFYSGGRVR